MFFFDRLYVDNVVKVNRVVDRVFFDLKDDDVDDEKKNVSVDKNGVDNKKLFPLVVMTRLI